MAVTRSESKQATGRDKKRTKSKQNMSQAGFFEGRAKSVGCAREYFSKSMLQTRTRTCRCVVMKNGARAHLLDKTHYTPTYDRMYVCP